MYVTMCVCMRVYACMHLNVHACMQVRRQVAEGSKDELTMKGHVADLSAALKQVGACILCIFVSIVRYCLCCMQCVVCTSKGMYVGMYACKP